LQKRKEVFLEIHQVWGRGKGGKRKKKEKKKEENHFPSCLNPHILT